ncbi:MAG: hypothetical protein ABI863_11790 [Ginsengibacter sp.]
MSQYVQCEEQMYDVRCTMFDVRCEGNVRSEDREALGRIMRYIAFISESAKIH